MTSTPFRGQTRGMDAKMLDRRRDDVQVVDVREPNEWNLGHVPGAVHVPRGWLEFKIEGLARRDQKVVLYCAGGDRSALAADALRAMGYADVASMAGGFRAWYEGGGDVED